MKHEILIAPGDPAAVHPFTIVFVANPALERGPGSGAYTRDDVLADPVGYETCVRYAVSCLYGDLPGQAEKLLGPFRSQIKIVSLFDDSPAPADDTALVTIEDPRYHEILSPRYDKIPDFLAAYGLSADVVFAVSASPEPFTRSAALEAIDDLPRGGQSFTLDGFSGIHCYFSEVPGTIALHVTARSLDPLHEFGHAMGTYDNGQVDDLYNCNSPSYPVSVNKRSRDTSGSVPASFAAYQGSTYRSDPVRDSLGYEQGCSTFHCELGATGYPAVMDNYRKAASALACRNDKITAVFLQDRLQAKTSR